MKTTIYSTSSVLLSDMHSPAGIYAKLRNLYPETFLLESNDYLGEQNAHSIMCAHPIASFEVRSGKVATSQKLSTDVPVLEQFTQFLSSFELKENSDIRSKNGFFGFTTYDAIQYFEDIRFKERQTAASIPDLAYFLFEYVLTFDHLRHTLTITHNATTPLKTPDPFIATIKDLLFQPLPPSIPFSLEGEESSPSTDEEFLKGVAKLKEHIHRGDIFQVVPSRKYRQKFKGDDLQVYRALRSINPSPYLFYFDFGDFRLFGSSPEAALVVQGNIATLNPIAGTCRRSGDPAIDKQKIDALLKDPKESAEHVMLVDLARNDLSRSCYPVQVKDYKQVQLYSHVIHLVSAVTGILKDQSRSEKIFADTFPAGTVTGAPKYRAMELIDSIEPEARSFYAGAVGFFGFDGSCVHALTIRSFLSKDETLTYQAGAGVVADSDPQKELDEITNKLGALRAAMKKGETING